MHHRSTFLALLLALSFLWISIPQPVTAQEATITPDPLTSAPDGTELPVTVAPLSAGISSPEDGAILSGVVEISGAALSAWDLSFSYADDLTGTWFALAQSGEPVSAGMFASWDTTALTDGLYVLRLRILASDAEQDFKVNVRIQNDVPLETASPSPTLTATPTLTPTALATALEAPDATLTPAPSPTLSGPLPPNPATLDPQEIAINFGKGALAVTAVFIFFGLLLSLSRKLRS